MEVEEPTQPGSIEYSPDVVKEKDFVILEVNNNAHIIAQVTPTSTSRLSKKYRKVHLKPILGAPYGSFFELRGGHLIPMKTQTRDLVGKAEITGDAENDVKGRDNRNLNNNADVQKLSAEAIEEMKKKGHTGAEIVQALIESSETYASKTEYSKEKWLKKKQEQYYTIVEVIKPTAYTMCSSYFKKHLKKINGMRPDSLALILLKSNIHALNKSVIVVEEIRGLLVGSVAERMGNGVLVNMYTGKQPSIAMVNFFNLSEDECSVISNLTYGELNAIASNKPLPHPVDVDISTFSEEKKRHVLAVREKRAEKRIKRRAELEKIIKNGAEALIVAVTGDALAVVRTMYPYLCPGQPFAIYSEYTQTLIECHEALKRGDAAIDLELQESWFREYQVLPNRTHPYNNMTGGTEIHVFDANLSGGGYVLTGIKTSTKFGEGVLNAVANGAPLGHIPSSNNTETVVEEPNKKHKTEHESS